MSVESGADPSDAGAAVIDAAIRKMRRAARAKGMQFEILRVLGDSVVVGSRRPTGRLLENELHRMQVSFGDDGRIRIEDLDPGTDPSPVESGEPASPRAALGRALERMEETAAEKGFDFRITSVSGLRAEVKMTRHRRLVPTVRRMRVEAGPSGQITVEDVEA